MKQSYSYNDNYNKFICYQCLYNSCMCAVAITYFCHRVNAYIAHGWASAIVDPDHGEARPMSKDDAATGTDGHDWQPLKKLLILSILYLIS